MLTIRAINMVLIVEDEITLVDTGLRGSSPQIIDFINQLGRSPEETLRILDSLQSGDLCPCNRQIGGETLGKA